MAPTDLEQLLAMGFLQDKADLALKKSGNLDQAIDWLDKNADRTVEEINAETSEAADDPDVGPALKPGEIAQSLVCNDCGRQLRSHAQAEFHASKTGHINFSESTESIKPLTEEEKKAKLEELRQKAAAKRAGTQDVDKAEQKRNEEIRRKATKETQDIKEDLQKKEQIKEAEKKRKEKQDDIAAKQRIKSKIEEDKEERRLKAAKEKAEREGRAPAAQQSVAAPAATSGPVTSKPASAYTEARLRFQTSGGSITKTFPVETTLFEVASAVSQDTGSEVQSFTQNFPKKVFDSVDFGATLKELGLVPSEQHKAATASVNPFEETKPHITEYTAQEIATLSSRLEKQLGPEYISSRPGPAGQKVHYLAADKCIGLANGVFGFNGWSSGIQNIQIDFVDENQQTGAVSLGLSVIVRVTLRDGTFHEDVGYGQIKNCKGKAEAFEKAKKEGTTDALKRALRNFGNLLGNCIYDKDYVSKVTKLKVAPTRWDANNLHRHPDFAPIKMERGPQNPQKSSDDARLERKSIADAETSLTGHGDPEDEFGSDEFDEVDLAVAPDGPPDGVALNSSVASRQFRSNVGLPQKRDPHPLPQTLSRPRPALSGPAFSPQTPSAVSTNGWAQPVKTEASNTVPQAQKAPPSLAHVASNRMPGAPAAPSGALISRPAEVVSSARALQTADRFAPDSTPPLDSSNTTQHNAPVGFFTARAAESLQKGVALPSNVPIFNPHLESPSIRKTAGVDHTKSKPVRTETLEASTIAAAVLPRTNFVNPQADKSRKVGMPVAAGSPLQNRGSYKPPQMKRQAYASGVPGVRPALNDVTSASVNLRNDAGGDFKRQRTAESAPSIAIT